MIRSMTGYGSAERTTDRVRISVEIRTVNNRSLKINPRTPEGFGTIEVEIERLLRERIGRGTVNVTLTVEPHGASARAPINRDVLSAYWNDLADLRKKVGEEAVSLDALLALPGVVSSETVLLSEIQDLPAQIQKAVGEALGRLDAMRETEGKVIRKDITAILDEMERHVAAIRHRTPTVVQEYQQRLKDRIADLLRGTEVPLDDQTLAREVAIFAERSDVNEELTRLASHAEQFRELLSTRGPVGRQLEFLTQEMYREANTIGAKANDAQISRDVVEIKVGVDRLREHSQNIE